MRPRPGLTALALSLLVACGGDRVPDSPERAALRLFELADGEPAAEELGRRFDLEPDDPRRAALLDALESIAEAEAPRVLEVQQIEDADRLAVDVEADLPGGGSATYSIQLRRSEHGEWVVHWFGGPSASWPAVGAAEPGLSSRPQNDRAPRRRAR